MLLLSCANTVFANSNTRQKIGGCFERKRVVRLSKANPGSAEVEIAQVMSHNVSAVGRETPIQIVHDLLEDSSSVILVEEDHVPKKIVTKIDLVQLMLGEHTKE